MAGRGLLFGSASAGVIDGGASNFNTLLLQNQRVPTTEPLGSLFMSGSSSSFLASASMVSFEDANGRNRSNRSFFCSFDQEENGDEDLDEYFHQPEKKKRLTADQVQFLEKSFEVENKLEPERKIQLAKDLGLQPRQVAIWFQNRRARWKTKQLEKDYEVLQARYNSLKSGYDSLLKEKDKLRTEVLNLTDKLNEKENAKGSSELSDAKKPTGAPPREQNVDSASEASKVSIVACKQEDNTSAKSDVFDSDSPHYTDGVHSSLLEPGDSSYVFEPEQSDLSQDEEDNFSKNILSPPAYVFPKIENVNYPDLPSSSCCFTFPIEDQTFGFWSC